MKKIISIFLLVSLLYNCDNTPQKGEENAKQTSISKDVIEDDSSKVFLITLDGLRWQELFTGTDSLLVTNSKFVKDTARLKEKFWKDNYKSRRETLLPFFWNTIAKNGTIYGNRKYENYVNLTNTHGFSYPGYNEILCGYADDENINTNDKNLNENQTVLEYLNKTKEFEGKVAAFASWDVFPYIINEERCGFPVNAGFEPVTTNPTDKELLLNKIQAETHSPWHNVRLDVFTHNYALEYIAKKHPKLLYIGYGETDDFGHDGDYDFYLQSAQRTDNFIKELWDTVQADPFYRDKTTFVITTDHGRGSEPLETWKDHGFGLKYHGKTFNIKGSEDTWLALLGPNIKKNGEVKEKGQLYSNQIAATVALLLGKEYKQEKAGKAIILDK